VLNKLDKPYFFLASLCLVCLRQWRQYFWYSSLRSTSFLFFLEK